MGFLDRLFGRKGAPAAVDEAPAPPCPHGSMSQHWDKPEDLGKRELISSYTCDACGQSFSREEGEALMVKAAEVIPIDESLRKTAEEESRDAAEGEKKYPI
jgi:hypothetical protein